MTAARDKREAFDLLIDEQTLDITENNKNKSSETGISSDYSDIDQYNAYSNSSDEVDNSQSMSSRSVNSQSQSDSDDTNSKCPDSGSKSKKSNAKNIFLSVLSPRERKTRKDKLNLNVVRDFCHEICRLDTFASAKIFVHNYDGTRSYHQMHVKSQSLKNYYKVFQNSTDYHNWQIENTRTTKSKCTQNQNGNLKKPTIKFGSFTNAFCPCCLSQKQRDCANRIQINLINALKALGNLRQYHAISVGIKSCNCEGHKNLNYLRCPTSLSGFMEAVLCPKISYAFLSADVNPSESIENQQNNHITIIAERDEINKSKTIKKRKSKLETRVVRMEGRAKDE